MPSKKKKIVYLFGTGATQAEASLIDDRIRLLMFDVKDGILKRMTNKHIEGFGGLKNELAGDNVDVEQLITLYDSSGNKQHKLTATLLKELFRAEIQERIQKLDEIQFPDGERFCPKLYSALIDMHEIEDFDEKIMGILTLNSEDIIERALQRVRGGVNYSVKINKKGKKYFQLKKDNIPILKLHGSFNWKNEYPISLEDDLEEEVLWIPPGVEKQHESYPFNIIWGKAKELLDCDILRIVGCSLSRNDWHLVSLLYTTQKLNAYRKEYTIELINRPSDGEIIHRNYPHLRIREIHEIKEIRKFVFKSLFRLSTGANDTGIRDETIKNYLEKSNIFETWLRAKGEDILDRELKLETSKNIFRDYLKEA